MEKKWKSDFLSKAINVCVIDFFLLIQRESFADQQFLMFTDAV
jgi:hypothetical protein